METGRRITKTKIWLKKGKRPKGKLTRRSSGSIKREAWLGKSPANTATVFSNQDKKKFHTPANIWSAIQRTSSAASATRNSAETRSAITSMKLLTALIAGRSLSTPAIWRLTWRTSTDMKSLFNLREKLKRPIKRKQNQFLKDQSQNTTKKRRNLSVVSMQLLIFGDFGLNFWLF